MTEKMEIKAILETLKKSQKGIRKTNLNREAKDNKSYSPYQTLISCLISLRVKDEISEKISQDLFAVADTPEKMLALPDKELERIIFKSGYYRNKTKAIKKSSEQILRDYGGKVPDIKEELLKLYGVGPKTANIVLCFAYDKTVIPVDVNVHRVSNRLGWVKTGKNKFEDSEKELEKILPKNYWREINGLFILHGKQVCVPISPRCSICAVSHLCPKVGVNKSR